jgi:hypothetical protein
LVGPALLGRGWLGRGGPGHELWSPEVGTDMAPLVR